MKPKPDWMSKEPEKSEVFKPRQWEGYTWWWCGKSTNGYCEKFRQHRGKDCKGLVRQSTKNDTKEDDTVDTKTEDNKRQTRSSKRNDNKRLKLNQALESIAQEQQPTHHE